MHALIVLAHPEPHSFNAHLAEQTRQSWQQRGHRATVLDLYREHFDPREGHWHYPLSNAADHVDVMQIQREHWRRQRLPADIEPHVHLLFQCDALIVHFPFWWFGLPAILKGWMDRVFVYGALYSSTQRYENGPMRGKRALLVSTAGTSMQACAVNGRDGDMRLMLWPVMHALHYIGFEPLEPYLIHGVRGGLRGAEADRQRDTLTQQAAEYRSKLVDWNSWPLVPFNRSEDFDDEQSLKSDAPVHSPFIRHHLRE